MRALGMIELTSVPRGFVVADEMLKAADVELITAQAVCAGKYIVIIGGSVAAINSSVEAGGKIAEEKLIDSIVIANVHEGVFGALTASTDVADINALGIIETFSLCTAVIAADAMIKSADVELIEVRLGRGLGGKSFITLTGDVAAVNSAVEVACGLEEAQGLISGCEVIASPHPDLFEAIY